MSITALQALEAAGQAARRSGDYNTAIGYAMDAQLLLGTTPNLQRSVGSGSQSITWNDGTNIDRFIANCRQLLKSARIASSGAFATSNVRYSRAAEETS